jgi:hypothetical protein
MQIGVEVNKTKVVRTKVARFTVNRVNVAKR